MKLILRKLPGTTYLELCYIHQRRRDISTSLHTCTLVKFNDLAVVKCRVVYTDRLITQYSTRTGKINIRRRKYACYVRTFKNVLFYWSLDKGRGHNKLLELENQTSIYANRE